MQWLQPFLAPRVVNGLAFLACVVAMVFVLYLQHYQHLEPCPLCVFQRVGAIIAGAFFLLACLHNPARLGQRIYALLALSGTVFGVVVAGRHVWLQNLPADQVPACGPSLDWMLEAFPMQKVFTQVFQGSGECATIDWMFLGLSLPGWALFLFVGLTGVALFQLLRPYRT